MYGYAGYAKVSYATRLHHVWLRIGYTKFGYATSLRHTRLRNMLMPPMVMSVTPNSVTLHSYATCGYASYAMVTPNSVTSHGYATYGYAGYAKFSYAAYVEFGYAIKGVVY